MDKTEPKRPLTVAELIEQLRQYPADMPVLHEGCDCWGEASGLVAKKDGKVDCVLITRHGGDYEPRPRQRYAKGETWEIVFVPPTT